MNPVLQILVGWILSSLLVASGFSAVMRLNRQGGRPRLDLRVGSAHKKGKT